MKILLYFSFLIAPYIANAQSVIIESKKYYAVFKNDYRHDTAVYQLPDIIGGISNDTYHKLSPYLSADSILGENIDSVLNNYKQFGAGQTSCAYNILYNENGALSISIYIETLGAYPDSYYQDINLNLNTGERILITDLIKADAMSRLAKRLDDTVQMRIKNKIREENINKEDKQWLFGDAKFTVESLSYFAIKKGGIMFYYNFGLPHVAKALSPDEDIWMSWEQLSDYTKQSAKKYSN